jgi:hypothetical protein
MPEIAPPQHEKAPQAIQSLVAEITQLSKTLLPPEQFYAEFLPRVVAALAAFGGAVWTLSSELEMAIQYEVNFEKAGIGDSERLKAEHGRLLHKVFSRGRGMLAPPHSAPDEVAPSEEETSPVNPTDHLLVFGLFKIGEKRTGLVEIFQRFDAGPNARTVQKGYLRFLWQMCELASDFHARINRE